MKDFIAIDFETGNPQRVSACSLGYAKVSGGNVVESQSFLIRPVGGHAAFQSKIHGINEEHTADKPDFGQLFPTIKGIFTAPLVAHSLFDKQVLNALSDHFNLSLSFSYTDSSSIAKQKLPQLKDHKLKTLAKHFKIPSFKHHDAKEDASACALIFLNLISDISPDSALKPSGKSEFEGLLRGILADQEINYKEAYELLYWLDDHADIRSKHPEVYSNLKEALTDNALDSNEAVEIKSILTKVFKTLETGIKT